MVKIAVAVILLVGIALSSPFFSMGLQAIFMDPDSEKYLPIIVFFNGLGIFSIGLLILASVASVAMHLLEHK